ncbi:hypothetical protein ACTWJ8_11520 [Streptomyces sp. SDT5-1]|uniref:hypothetical protein n=1 Tax=Streptomyces sp. SDT5-1 TaxID=3406418 RepID=UPI003FD691E7
MRDVMVALAAPAVMCASGLYALCAAWWRRRRPAPEPWSQAGLRLAGERAVAVAEAVVADQYALLTCDAGRTGAKTGRMRHHERPVAGDRVTEGRSGEAP